MPNGRVSGLYIQGPGFNTLKLKNTLSYFDEVFVISMKGLTNTHCEYTKLGILGTRQKNIPGIEYTHLMPVFGKQRQEDF